MSSAAAISRAAIRRYSFGGEPPKRIVIVAFDSLGKPVSGLARRTGNKALEEERKAAGEGCCGTMRSRASRSSPTRPNGRDAVDLDVERWQQKSQVGRRGNWGELADASLIGPKALCSHGLDAA